MFFELESKARGDRELLVKKKDKKLSDDTMLTKCISDYLNLRLNIKQDPLPWPSFMVPTSGTSRTSQSNLAIVAAQLPSASDTTTSQETDITSSALNISSDSSAVYTERMCTFERLAGDECESLEVPCPNNYSDSGVPHAKFRLETIVTPSIIIDSPLTQPPTSTAASVSGALTATSVTSVSGTIDIGTGSAPTTQNELITRKTASTAGAKPSTTNVTVVALAGATSAPLTQNVNTKVTKKPAATASSTSIGITKTPTKKVTPNG